MFDASLRPLVDRLLFPVGGWLARRGVSANSVTFAGFGLGVGAAMAVAVGAFWVAAFLIVANRLADGLDGAVAQASRPTDLGGYLDITLDFLFYSAIPFSFAAYDPANALAASFLIFSFLGTGSSFLAFAIIAQKRGISTDIRGKKTFFYLGGLTEGGETIIFLLAIVVLPQFFVPMAIGFGALCWITTFTRIQAAISMFD